MITLDVGTDLRIPTLFDPTARALTYGTTPCDACRAAHEYWGQPRGHRVNWHGKTCDKCKGTGRRGSGRCRACNGDAWSNREYGAGMVRDMDAPYDAGPCDTCDATGVRMATRYDYLPVGTVSAILDTIGDDDIRIITGDRQTSGEALFGVVTFTPEKSGFTNMWGVTDYGRTWGPLRDAAMIDKADREAGGDGVGALRAAIDTLKATIREAILGHSPMQATLMTLPDERVIDTIVVRVTPQGYTLMGAVRAAVADAMPGPGDPS